MNHTQPTTKANGLYHRRRDGKASDPVQAAHLHMLARTIYNVIMDLESIDTTPKSRGGQKLHKGALHLNLFSAVGELNRVEDFLSRLQDDALPIGFGDDLLSEPRS
ncbi:hypothetical protein BH24CHL4_BH24CHL4_10020 [soil metagenome]